MADWRFVYRDSFSFVGNELVWIPINFTSKQLIVRVDLATYTYVGSLIPHAFIDGFGYVQLDRVTLRPNTQLITIPTAYPYRLQFEPARKLTNVQLSFWINPMPINNSGTGGYVLSTATTSATVASATTNQALLAANANRKGASIWNNGSATLYVDVDGAASTTDYAFQLAPNGYAEIPFGYTGAISGIWSAVSGNALVREYT